MDRNTVTATVLIALVMVAWVFWMRPEQNPTPPPVPQDSLAAVVDPVAPLAARPDTLAVDTTLGAATRGTARTITVETERYTARLSTQGATLRSFRLKDYTRADRRTPVELVDSAGAVRGALGLVFTTPGNRTVDTRGLYFTPTLAGDVLRVTGDSLVVPFEARLGTGVLRLSYVFHKDSYEVGWRVERENAGAYATPDGYSVVWNGAVPFAEESTQEEVTRSGAYARSGGELVAASLASETSVERPLSGAVDWVAVKNKYFTVALLPGRTTESANLSGSRTGEVSAPNVREHFDLRLDMPALADGGVDRYRLYLGPVDYLKLAKYPGDLFDMVDLGWDWLEVVTRPLAKFVLVPLFAFFGALLPNYGWVLILLALLVKLVTHPLTRAQTKSMARMRDLQPRMEALKEKYANDPQGQQQATMRLYKEAGVNPLGGCLPMLLQYPVIIALWQFIPQSLTLRQEPFLWAPDLSAPDPILHLPFAIPLYGNFVAGFTLLMGLALLVQMKLQMKNQPVNDQTKIMTWMMPVMLFFFFNKQSSGLSLYYLFYNVFSAFEQWWVRRSMPPLALASDADTTPKAPAAPRSTPPKRKLEAATASTNGKPKR